MRRLIVALALFLCLGFFFASTYPVAAMCVKLDSFQAYRKQADIVLSGTATIVVGKDGFVSVDEYFKGHGPQTVRVTGLATDSGISSEDFQLEEGQKYLLFLKIIGGGSDQLRTNSCMGNKLVSATGLSPSDRQALGKSKISMTPTPSEAFHTMYKMTPVSLFVMFFSGGAIFLLLLLSIVNEKKRKRTKGKKKSVRKK
jgi:hypothetical protein